jgi:hypothetical protein
MNTQGIEGLFLLLHARPVRRTSATMPAAFQISPWRADVYASANIVEFLSMTVLKSLSSVKQ